MKILHNFLGIPRWLALRDALLAQSVGSKLSVLEDKFVFIALTICLAPLLLTLASNFRTDISSNLIAAAFGVSALASLLLRGTLQLKSESKPDWKQSLSLTHTAVALGCIPAVCIVLLAPDLLLERREILGEALIPGYREQAVEPSILMILCIALGIAAWAAVTEELIFRGLLFSTLRRWQILRNQRSRDIFAVLLSASLFGLAHYWTWGPLATIALVGLGLGFVLAYLANGEQLMPVILYHFAFDFLSIGICFLL